MKTKIALTVPLFFVLAALIMIQVVRVQAVSLEVNPLTSPLTGPEVSASPSAEPSASPEVSPSASPSTSPIPSVSPSIIPSVSPSASASAIPSVSPSPIPSPAVFVLSGKVSEFGFFHHHFMGNPAGVTIKAINFFSGATYWTQTDDGGMYSLALSKGSYLIVPQGGNIPMFNPLLKFITIGSNMSLNFAGTVMDLLFP